jgi:dGTPase
VLANFSPAVADRVKELKQIMRDHLYRHPRVVHMNEEAGRVLTGLFEAYLSDPKLIPAHVRERGERDGEPLPQVIADYIAGMTDRFALDEHRRLFNQQDGV